jgi:NADPH2:quinone reductase
VINYRVGDPAKEIKALVPAGVDLIVEVNPGVNAELDGAVLGLGGAVAYYSAGDLKEQIGVPAFPSMWNNQAWHGILVYTVSAAVKDRAVADVSAAVAAGGLRVGAEAGLPLHRFPLERTGEAHDAVEAGAVGKVLIDVV